MKFEYTIFAISKSAKSKELAEALVKFGNAGWKLVSVVVLDDNIIAHYFERPKS